MKLLLMRLSLLIGFFSLMSFLFASPAYAKNLRVFVSVSGEGRNDNWARQQCQMFHHALNQTIAVNVACDWNNENALITDAHRAARSSLRYDLFLESHDDDKHVTHLRAVNWTKTYDNEFFQVSWNLASSENYLANVQKLVNHIVQLKLNSKLYRTSILANLAKESESIRFDQKKGQFFERLTGLLLPLHIAENRFTDESPQKKDYLTASLEVFVIMGAGLTWYRSNSEKMSRDWDYQNGSEVLRKTLNGERIRFDDNGFDGVNWPHTYAAIPEYLLCRANGFSLGESFLCSFTASLIWENIIEFREVLSINDQTATTIGGFVIGESLFQLQRYFSQRSNRGPLNQVFAAIFSTPEKFNNYIQKNGLRGRALGLSSKTLSTPLWGKAELYLEVEKQPTSVHGTPARIGFNGQTISLSGWNESGRDEGFQGETAATAFLVEGVLNSEKAGQDLHLMSKIAFATWKQKRLVKDEAGRLTGYQFFVGAGSAVEMRQSDDDFFGSIDILGTTAHLELFEKNMKLTAEVAMYGDFAMVHSLSIADYKNERGAQGLATVLQHNNYYYAVGTTTRGQVILEKSKWGVGANFSVHDWGSINGLYRFQDQVTNDIRLADQEQEAEVFIKYKISKNFQVKFGTSIIHRKSNIENKLTKTQTEHRMTARLSYLF